MPLKFPTSLEIQVTDWASAHTKYGPNVIDDVEIIDLPEIEELFENLNEQYRVAEQNRDRALNLMLNELSKVQSLEKEVAKLRAHAALLENEVATLTRENEELAASHNV